MGTCQTNLIAKYKKGAASIMEEFEQFKARYGVSENDDIAVKLNQFLEEKGRKIEMGKRERLQSIQKHEEMRGMIFKNMSISDPNYAKNIRKNFRQNMQNISDRGSAIADDGVAMLSDLYNDKAMRKMMAEPDFQKNIYRGIQEPNKYKFADGSPVARGIKAVKKLNDWLHTRKVQAGYEVGFKEGYVSKQLHNYDKIVGNEATWSATLKRDLDWKKMGFETQDEIDDYLTKTYANMSKPKNMIDDQFIELTRGTKKGVTAKRSFEFKNADAAFAYQTEFGGNNLFDQLAKTINVDAKKIAMAEHFSTRHELNFKKMIQETANMDTVSPGSHKAMKREMDAAYNFLTGKTSHGSATTFKGKFSTALRQVADMSLLSLKSLPTTVTDTSLGAGTLNSILGGGVNGYGNKFVKSLTETVKLFANKKLAVEYAERIGVFMNEANPVNGMQFAREGVETGGSWKAMNRAHNFFMAATGLPRQAVAARIATAKQVAIGLANVADQSFDNLYVGTKNVLNDLNISADDWDVIRTAGLDDLDGNAMISAAKLRDLGHLELGGKYASLLRQISEVGSPTSSLRLTVIKNMHSPDSVEGILMRTMLQYKSFPISALRTMNKIGQGGNPMGNMAMTAAASTALGVGVIQMRNFANKGEFKNNDQDLWIDGFAQGGTGGLIGDMLTADYSTSYRSVTADIAGPVPSMVSGAAKIISKAKMGKGVNKDLKNFAWRNFPGLINSPILWKKMFSLMGEL